MDERIHIESIEDLQSLLKQNRLLKRFSIQRLGVFGSFARNEPANDIDLLIEGNIPLATAYEFKRALEALIDNPLDVLVRAWANPIVLYRARKDLLYVEG